MSITTYTPNLRLRISSDLTDDAVYNLNRIDTLSAGGTSQFDASQVVSSVFATARIPVIPLSLGGFGQSMASATGIPTFSGDAFQLLTTGVGANNLVQLDSNAKLPAVDGSQLTHLSFSGFGGVLPLANGGTGTAAVSANAALTALTPQTTKGDLLGFSSVPVRIAVGTNGQVLTADSAQASGLNWSSPLTNPMSTVGDLIVGGASGAATRFAGPTSTTKQFLTSTGTGSAATAPVWGTIQAADVPVLNQNTTGNAATATFATSAGSASTATTATSATTATTAGNITATSNATITSLSALASATSLAAVGTITTGTWQATPVAVTYGGTGASNQQAAINALTGTQSAGKYLRSDGTNASLSTIQSGDVPTLNQSTTGTASNITGTSNSSLTTLSGLTTAASLSTVGTVTAGTWSSTLTSASVSNYLEFAEGNAPAQPAASKLRLFAQLGDTLATMNSAGTVTTVGSGSGQKNYVQASSSTSGSWTAYGNVTVSTDTTAADLPRANTTQTGWKLTPSGSTSGTATFPSSGTTITATAHGMQTGFPVTFGTTVGGVTAGTVYYATYLSANTFSISTTMANCVAGTFVTVTTASPTFTYGGAYLRFTLDAADYNVKQQIQWAQNILSGATGDWEVDVYSNTASNYSGTYTRLPLSTDSSGSSTLPNLEGTYRTTFDAPGSAQQYIEIRFNKLAANTHSLVGSDLIVGPGVVTQGAAVTQTVSESNVTPTNFGTVTNTRLFSARHGDRLHVEGTFDTGSLGTGLKLAIGGSRTINTAGLTSTANTAAVGRWVRMRSSSSAISSQDNEGVIFFDGTDTANLYFASAVASFTLTKSDTFMASNERLFVEFTAPINEWAGSGTLNVSQNDITYYYPSGGTWGTSGNVTTNIGPAGSLGGTTTPSGTAFQWTMTPTYIVPVGAVAQIQTSPDQKNWSTGYNVGLGIESARFDGTNTIGATAYLNSSGNIVIDFGKFAQGTSGAWTGTWYMRVAVGLPGQAVGFGTVSSTSAGLMPASNTNLDDASATRLGFKQYLSSGSYNGGLAPTVTCSQAGTSVVRGVFVPYQTNDGAWRLRANLAITFTSATVTSLPVINVAGITAKNVSGFYQPVSSILVASGQGGLVQNYIAPNSGDFHLVYLSTSGTTGATASADVELDSKPTWAY